MNFKQKQIEGIKTPQVDTIYKMKLTSPMGETQWLDITPLTLDLIQHAVRDGVSLSEIIESGVYESLTKGSNNI